MDKKYWTEQIQKHLERLEQLHLESRHGSRRYKWINKHINNYL